MKSRIILPLMLVAFFVSGCGSARWQESEISNEGGVSVKLQQRVEDNRPVELNYSHPADIDPDVLERFFRDLEYAYKSGILGGVDHSPVFQDHEIERLAPSVSRAIEKADSTRRVHFTSFNYGREFLFKKRRITRGVVFVDKDEKLNIAFSWINQPVNLEDRPKTAGETGRREAVEIADSSRSLSADVAYAANAELENGKSAPMWIKADMDGLMKAAKDTGESEKPQDEPSQGKETIAEEPEKTPDKEVDGSRDEIRSRLEYLKELYEDDLINESEYESQRKQILEDLDQ
ncbi:MAG: hypothetical protein ACQETG_05255 [Thermodesulfobacteriota bacterium]